MLDPAACTPRYNLENIFFTLASHNIMVEFVLLDHGNNRNNVNVKLGKVACL